MADLSITAANVATQSDTVKEYGVAGEALTAGQAVYKKAADGKWYKADCNSATAEVRVAGGVCLTGSASGQPCAVATGGTLGIGATVAVGVVYYLSGTAGGIRPVADNTTGDYVQAIGIGTTTAILRLSFALQAGAAMA